MLFVGPMAGAFATSIRAKRLILTHFSMRHSTPGSEFSVDDIVNETRASTYMEGQLLAAHDLMVFDVPPITWPKE